MDARQFEILKKFKRSQIEELTIFEQKKDMYIGLTYIYRPLFLKNFKSFLRYR